MKHVTLATTGCALALCLALGCGGKSSDQARIGGETNWMVSCGSDADCVVGSCLCNLCTVECRDTLDSCSAGPPGSSCTTSNLPAGCATELVLAPSGGICLSPKADDLPLAPSSPSPSPSLSLDATLETMARDLAAQPAADRPFLRYLSVANLAGDFPDPIDAESTPAAERIARRVERGGLAVAKLANSVSMAPATAIPSAVGDAQLIQRIDMRAYDWNRTVTIDGVQYSDGWEAIVSHAALAVEYRGPAADRLKTLAGARVPWLFADDFVSTAAAGRVYYALLSMPDDLRILDQVLVPDDSTALFAAFSNSGVSQAGRIVERRTFRAGRSIWLAFDFSPKNVSTAALLDNPFGFSPDSTEVIYQLPNGLNAFFVANANGERVDVSPLSPLTVTDPAQPDGALRSAVSCFSCHNFGAIDFVDQFRSRFDASPSPDLGPEDRAQLAALYPQDSARLVALARADSQRYSDSIESAGVGRSSPDPIERIALDFQRDVPAARAAGELFVTPAALAASAVVSRYPLNALGSDGGSVPRPTFSKNYLTALCTLHSESENQPVACP